jgi:membrane fusion protein, multidrug efflux system
MNLSSACSSRLFDRRKTLRPINISLPWLLPALCAALLTACSPPKPAPLPLPKVTVSQPQLATVTNWDEYPGHLDAVEMVEIRPRVAGYIDSIHFQEGTEVKAGDLLCVIDPRPYQAELEHAQAQRQQAETRLELARSDLKRAEGLRGTKAISAEEYDSRSNAVREAEAALAAVKASEAIARINLGYTQIKAPISGKIGRRLVTAGNFVQLQGNGGSASVLATIVSVDPIYCYFDVEESAFLKYRSSVNAGTSNVNAGANATFTVAASGTAPLSYQWRFNGSNPADAGGGLACELALVNEEDFAHRGRLDFFDNQVNPQTGTIRLRAVFDNGDRALVPGMFANLRVLAGPPEQTLVIPDVAVQSDQGYKFVYVVNAEDVVKKRDITTGRAHGPLRIVLKGLTADDRVIVNGLMMLRPGAKVVVQTPESKPQSEKAAAPTDKPQAKP